MKRIAILGGTFDPITNAHLEIAEKIGTKFNCSVLLMPAKNTRWKDNISDIRHRVNMINLAIKDKKNIGVCLLEANQDTTKTQYTIDAILELLEIYKDTEIYYIIGTDQLSRLHEWMNVEDLSTLVNFVVIHRDNQPIHKENFELFNCIDSELYIGDISSTKIRNHESNDTPTEVQKYIKEKGLYLENVLKNMLTEERFNHSLSVAKTAQEIALALNYDQDKAYLAGLVHDCAKNLDKAKAIEMLMQNEPEHINDPVNLYHQVLAPYIAKEIGVEDEEILEAIRYHATSKLKPSVLDMIVYTADKVEPTRNFDTEFYREKTKENLIVGYYYTYKYIQEWIAEKTKKIPKESKIIYKNAIANLELYELQQIAKLLDDGFGEDIKIFDVSDINPLNKYVINVSCGSNRQLMGLADDVEDLLFKNKFDFHHKEAQYKSGWVLVDCVNIVVNLFHKDVRGTYDLETVWKDQKQLDLDKLLNYKFKV